MLASYILSRTLVPTMAMYLLRRRSTHGNGARRAIRWSVFSGRSKRGSSRLRARLSRCSSTVWFTTADSSFRSSWSASWRSSRWCHGSARISSRTPTAANSSAYAGKDRNTYRGDGADRRSRRRRDPQIIPAGRDGQHHRQYRPALQRHEPDPHISGVIGAADADIMVSLKREPSSDRRLRRRSARALAARLSRRHLLLPAGGHDDADPQFRPAVTDRYPDQRRTTSTPIAPWPTSC